MDLLRREVTASPWRMMRLRAQGTAYVAMITALGLGLAGCLPSGPALETRALALADELEQSSLGVSRADVLAPSSFTGSLDVTVALDEAAIDRGSSISAERLREILHVIGESATDMRVGSVMLYAEDDQGADVDMTRAAEELGISKNQSGRSLSFSGEELENLPTPVATGSMQIERVPGVVTRPVSPRQDPAALRAVAP